MSERDKPKKNKSLFEVMRTPGENSDDEYIEFEPERFRMNGPTIVSIPCDEIIDWDTFHAVFKKVLGFPDFYGENMNAWIDCMDDLENMSQIRVSLSDVLIIRLENARQFSKRCPEQYQALLDDAAFVNKRCIARGERPVLSIMPIDSE